MLMTVALEIVDKTCAQPLAVDEVAKVAGSVWLMTVAGRNYVGQNVTIIRQSIVRALIEAGKHDALVLLNYLHANQGPEASFWIANGLAEKLDGSASASPPPENA